MRNHVLRLWNHWRRHTCYRSLAAEQQLEVNETKNTTERVISWGIKERYRTMRGYKRDESVKNVAHLTTRGRWENTIDKSPSAAYNECHKVAWRGGGDQRDQRAHLIEKPFCRNLSHDRAKQGGKNHGNPING